MFFSAVAVISVSFPGWRRELGDRSGPDATQ
jgi:hypothetical protein